MARELVHETIIQPGTGKALVVKRGQVLRIEQLENGGQCADFNCFNLHDYKEHFHTARTRHLHGLSPTTGAFLWSAPPRDRPIAVIVADTVGSNDILYGRCSAWLYDYQYGLAEHANCHDIQAEAQREFGLTPDDVHDSFNFFMNTGVDQEGHPFIGPNLSKKGDYVEILALIDTIMVPNVCGADVMATNNFQYKPLRLTVYDTDEAEVIEHEARPEMRKLVTQRDPSNFAQARIKATRELERDTEYVPNFTNVPIRLEELTVALGGDDLSRLDQLVASKDFGATRSEALRYIFFVWWISKFMQGPKHLDRSAAKEKPGK